MTQHRAPAPETSLCWCGKAHPEQPADITEAWPTFWHSVVAALRIPQFVGWLSEKIA